jgi:AbrB family looped-hinge helix DNA binding protein
MTNDEIPGTPAYFAAQLEEMQDAGEKVTEQQAEWLQKLLSSTQQAPGFPGMDFGEFGPLGAAVFKTRVQSNGRISIPDAEREALDIGEGDIVQTFVVPVKRSGDSNE